MRSFILTSFIVLSLILSGCDSDTSLDYSNVNNVYIATTELEFTNGLLDQEWKDIFYELDKDKIPELFELINTVSVKNGSEGQFVGGGYTVYKSIPTENKYDIIEIHMQAYGGKRSEQWNLEMKNALDANQSMFSTFVEKNAQMIEFVPYKTNGKCFQRFWKGK